MDFVRDPFPAPVYDTIVAFAVLEYLSPEDGAVLLEKVGSALSSKGTFLGSVPLVRPDFAEHPQQITRFTSEQRLREFVDPHFQRITYFMTRSPVAEQIYFECSLPRRSTQSRGNAD